MAGIDDDESDEVISLDDESDVAPVQVDFKEYRNNGSGFVLTSNPVDQKNHVGQMQRVSLQQNSGAASKTRGAVPHAWSKPTEHVLRGKVAYPSRSVHVPFAKQTARPKHVSSGPSQELRRNGFWKQQSIPCLKLGERRSTPDAQSRPAMRPNGFQTIGRCKECLSRGPGCMGPAGTEYANSFYCESCWASWTSEHACASADDEFATAAEMEVAALLSWRSPGYRLERLQIADAVIAEAEFNRLTKLIGVDHAKRIVEELSRLAKASTPTLRSEVKKFEYPPVRESDPVREKRMLLACLKDILTWESLGVSELRKVCSKKHMTMPANASHAEMFRCLADLAWKDRGITVSDLPSSMTPIGLLERLDMFEKKSVKDLQAYLHGKIAGSPLEGVDLSKRNLLAILGDFMLWENATDEEMKEFCAKRGIRVDNLVSCVAENPGRKLMMQKLLEKRAREILDAQESLLKRISSLADKSELLREFRRLEDLSFADLRREYKYVWSLPVEPGMDETRLIRFLKSLLVWSKSHAADLRNEISALAISYDCAGKTSDELVQQLMVETSAARWHELGVPVYRIGPLHGSITVIEQWERLERMSDVMLSREWKTNSFPFSPDDVLPDIVKQCLKSAAVWQQLPLDELKAECKKEGINLTNPSSSSDDEAHDRSKLCDKLVQVSCAKAVYEAKGVPVERLHTLEAAEKLYMQYLELDRMSDDELVAEYCSFGLPLGRDCNAEVLLPRLRDLHLWEMLPADALREECKKRGIKLSTEEKRTLPIVLAKPKESEDDRNRELLLDRIMLTLCEHHYNLKGVPAMQLGSVKAAERVADEFACLANMDIEDLRKKHSATGLPRPKGMSTRDFIKDLHMYTVWMEMPVCALRRAAQDAGVVSTTDAKISEEAIRKELIDRLVGARQNRHYEELGIPVRRLGVGAAGPRLLRIFEDLEAKTDDELVSECARRGIPTPPSKTSRADMLRRMKWAISLSELPFVELRKECVSSGVRGYHSASEEKRFEMTQKLLAITWEGLQAGKPSSAPRARAAGAHADNFRRLGLPPTAKLDDVKKAYRQLALKYHPDKQQDPDVHASSDKFLEVSKAYEALSEFLQPSKI